jgi:Dullard-like phosphatase family protein
MKVEKNENKSTNSLIQVRSSNFFKRRDDDFIQENEKEIELNLKPSEKNASSLNINYVVRSQRKTKTYKEDIKTSNKSLRSNYSSRKSVIFAQEKLKKYSTIKVVHSSNNIDDIRDFHEYTHECMKVLNKVEIDINEDFESKKVDLEEKYVKMINSGEKALAVFDLDETLIHRELEDFDDCDKVINVSLPDVDKNQIGIYLRPLLTESLKRISQNYILVLFTASQQVYADKVLELIDPDNQLFVKRLYRESCRVATLEDETIYVKDLNIFKYLPLERIVIIDNSVLSFCSHLDNGIPILPYFNNKYDCELSNLVGYLEHLRHAPDFREENKSLLALKHYYPTEGDSSIEFNSSSANSSDDDQHIQIEHHPQPVENKNLFLFNTNTTFSNENSVLSRANRYCSIYTTSEFSQSESSEYPKEVEKDDIQTKRHKQLFRYLEVFQTKYQKFSKPDSNEK